MIVRLILAVLTALIFAAPASAGVIWTAGMEDGTLSEWSTGGGGEFNSDGGDTIVENISPRTGTYAAKLKLDSDGAGGTRLFRWAEMRANRITTQYVWMKYANTYVPHTSGGFNNAFQIKSRSCPITHGICGDADGRNDPIWYLDNRGTRFDLIWWCGSSRPCTLAGPHSGEDGFRRYIQGTSGCDLSDCTVKDLPTPGTWFQVKMVVKQSHDFDGFVRVYQSSTKIFGLENVRTSFDNCSYNGWCAANEWSANLYSDGLDLASGGTATNAYARLDDASISIP